MRRIYERPIIGLRRVVLVGDIVAVQLVHVNATVTNPETAARFAAARQFDRGCAAPVFNRSRNMAERVLHGLNAGAMSCTSVGHGRLGEEVLHSATGRSQQALCLSSKARATG